MAHSWPGNAAREGGGLLLGISSFKHAVDGAIHKIFRNTLGFFYLRQNPLWTMMLYIMSPIYSLPLPLAVGSSSACPLTSLAIISTLTCLLQKYLKAAHAVKRKFIHTVRTCFFMQCWLLGSLTFVKEHQNQTGKWVFFFLISSLHIWGIFLFLWHRIATFRGDANIPPWVFHQERKKETLFVKNSWKLGIEDTSPHWKPLIF